MRSILRCRGTGRALLSADDCEGPSRVAEWATSGRSEGESVTHDPTQPVPTPDPPQRKASGNRKILYGVGGLVVLSTLIIGLGMGRESREDEARIVDPVSWTHCRDMG